MDVSRARILSCAEDAGLKLVNIYSETADCGTKAHLLEVLGYFDKDSDIQITIENTFEGKCTSCQLFGGYPVVPDIRDDKERLE